MSTTSFNYVHQNKTPNNFVLIFGYEMNSLNYATDIKYSLVLETTDNCFLCTSLFSSLKLSKHLKMTQSTILNS